MVDASKRKRKLMRNEAAVVLLTLLYNLTTCSWCLISQQSDCRVVLAARLSKSEHLVWNIPAPAEIRFSGTSEVCIYSLFFPSHARIRYVPPSSSQRTRVWADWPRPSSCWLSWQRAPSGPPSRKQLLPQHNDQLLQGSSPVQSSQAPIAFLNSFFR